MSIGGYQELDLPDLGSALHANAMALQSARACLYVYLEAVRPRKIFLPSFICESLFPVIDHFGIEREYYSIDEDLLPCIDQPVQPEAALLVVNYFGLLTDSLYEYCNRIDAAALIVDNAQGLFAPPLEGATTIYSARKFIGVPDGGFLYTDTPVHAPKQSYPAEKYLSHLMLRAGGEVAAGYDYYRESEAAFESIAPLKMSAISRRIIRSLDLGAISARRTQNFARLYHAFAESNRLQLDASAHAPLCYPLQLGTDVAEIVAELAGREIFLPRYWPNSLRQELSGPAAALVHNTLYLPTDHRISEESCLKLIEIVRQRI